jgi:type IV pilus assembly protein PilC
MPFYRYQAVDESGRVRRGVMAAADELSLERALKAAQLWPTEVQETRAPVTTAHPRSRPGGGPVLSAKRRRRALIEFCTMMAYQTKVGVPMVQAIESIGRHCDDPVFREVVRGVQGEIEAGLQLNEALARYHRTFSDEFVGIVRAGELSGDLPGAFQELKRYLNWVDRLLADMKQATLYPGIVITVVSLFVIFLFAFVVPTFANLLTKLNTPLPLVTQWVFGLGDAAKRYWWVPLVLGGVIGVGQRLLRRHSPRFAHEWDRMKLRLPLFGPLLHMLALSRFANNLSVMYRAGIPVLQALEMCRDLVGNLVVTDAVIRVQEAIEGGSTLSEAIQQAAVFPPLVLRMVVVGEGSGHLEATLQEVADYYNQTVPERAKKMLTFLEPALMLFLIFVVLIVALAVYLPILSLVGSIR